MPTTCFLEVQGTGKVFIGFIKRLFPNQRFFLLSDVQSLSRMSLPEGMDEYEDEEIELEIVEISETDEPVPMQDSCLQVSIYPSTIEYTNKHIRRPCRHK